MKFEAAFDDGIGHRARLGLIVLQSDETLEHDMRRLLPLDGVTLLVSRIPNAVDVTPDTLAAMEAALPETASRFPEGGSFDAVAYGCTSGTSTIGAAAVAAQVRQGCRTDHVTDPVTGLVAACRHLGLSRLALLTPYIETVNAKLRDTFAASGIDTPLFGTFDEQSDARVARIRPATIRDAAIALGNSGDCDGLFMSCTNLRTLDIIPEVEAAIGKPVLSSNQVMGWHLARLAGIAANHGFGRLTG